ncbi:MAG: 30S ribosomal protein S8 [Elusimicrobia bacterium GWC2_51_8]|nr:MAG: 30S ribosomal protein S8 [Elusimicrobia bacterium GWA2_51_34]OGR62460.1 MAG: 30S ribosomal protein S8 [Elusimicrobia bacterium GWC2_51_8]OGR85986.1 MAG: 30S ribosomal protein S8 [Elusimicrobia bacterium GWF2_52_66]HAF96452.1 30S ribosomal protein S8 [Elusimicrobiota bacterium]HCE97288.1 30S ribosomal protein S8 [Elusimicrobiota bacterium]
MDPISNMLTSVRNASAKRKERVDVPFSNIKANIVKVLKDEGFISNYKVLDPKTDKTLDRRGVIRIALKYTQSKKPVIIGIRRSSRPGLRIYRPYTEIPKVRAAFGVTIISTSKGILTGDQAKKERVGGEVLCQVW